jgi:glycosyltransferase involved in cell wall biosynthesis
MARISVIMPCHNHGKYLLQSVESVLRQTYSDLELIIIDDNSSDNSGQILHQIIRQDSRIKIIRHAENLGVSAARNNGIKISVGNTIAFCDADDIWALTKLETQLRCLGKHQCGFVYADARIIDEEGNETGKLFSELFKPPKRPSGNLFKQLALGNFINTQTVVVDKRYLEQVGLFDPGMKVLEDWWLWTQLSRHTSFCYVALSLGSYRVHSSSTNVIKKRLYHRTRFKILRRIHAKYQRELSSESIARLYYMAGVELAHLERKADARLFFWRALSCGKWDCLPIVPKVLVRMLLS